MQVFDGVRGKVVSSVSSVLLSFQGSFHAGSNNEPGLKSPNPAFGDPFQPVLNGYSSAFPQPGFHDCNLQGMK
jgi:hypothetical protein